MRYLSRRNLGIVAVFLAVLVPIFALVAFTAPDALPHLSLLIAHPITTLHGAVGGVGMLMANLPAVSLVSKDRAATELKAKAQAIRAELLDPDKTFSTDEVNTRMDAVRSLEARASAAAEFTADAEIGRSAATAGSQLVSEASPEGRTELPVRTPMNERMRDFAVRAVREFGDVKAFMEAASGRNAKLSQAQRAMLQECGTLTRAIVGTTGDISGGEYLLPLTQVATIFSLANVQQGILQRARVYNVPGRSLRIPYLIQDDIAASTTLNRPMAGNIANVAIVGEGSTKPTRAPEFGQRQLDVYKYAAITQVSDELLADDFTGELPQEFINAVGQQTMNAINENVTNTGTGSSQPTGAFYAGAWNIGVNRAVANQISPADCFQMYDRHTHGPKSCWFASRRTLQQLFAMSLTSASLVTFLRDLNGPPTMMLLGYPIVLTDLNPTLGSAGDLTLANPDFYAVALRQALTVESSRDFAFTQDLTTYRFVMRAGGLPINPGKYAYKYAGSAGVDEHSPFVYLDVPA